MVLTGEPGIGKSHIALAFQERLQAEPHIRLRHYCSAHHTNSALFPFISQLERAARFERSDSPAEKLAKLEALLVQSGANPAHSVPILANLLSLPPSERYPPARAEPAEAQGGDIGGAYGSARGPLGAAAGVGGVRGCPLDRPDLAGAARAFGGAPAAASGAAAHHREAGVRAALARSCACDDAPADAPEPTRRIGDRSSGSRPARRCPRR